MTDISKFCRHGAECRDFRLGYCACLHGGRLPASRSECYQRLLAFASQNGWTVSIIMPLIAAKVGRERSK
jgi:hypothetical protein